MVFVTDTVFQEEKEADLQEKKHALEKFEGELHYILEYSDDEEENIEEVKRIDSRGDIGKEMKDMQNLALSEVNPPQQEEKELELDQHKEEGKEGNDQSP
mmetsp:Transcript_35465/g.34511  ORF Transcript_35465/g.34511 Transcript_35465/m.34511 type:complete len:100 (+) Transcript_35465:641-940(+)